MTRGLKLKPMPIQLMRRFDIYDGKAAEHVAEAVFESRPESIENVDFGGEALQWSAHHALMLTSNPFTDNFYQSLTPHSAFVARVYFSYLRQTEDSRLADLEPVVTALAYYIQAEWTKLVVLLEAQERDEQAELMQEFIVGELVTMAVSVDYGDEIGRRKMFELIRTLYRSHTTRIRLLTFTSTGEMLSHFSLPPSLVPKCLDVLLRVNTSDKEFMRIVVEIVQSLRAESQLMTSDEEHVRRMNEEDDDEEDLEDEDAMARARRKADKRMNAPKEPAQVERRRELDLRCLIVVKALLERVTGVSRGSSRH